MSVVVIIVNYRTAQLTCDCLQSLLSELNWAEDRVVVVDNNSGDSSIEVISKFITETGFDQNISLITLKENRGFAFGNNRALDKVLGVDFRFDHIWLLNPDTIVRKNSRNALVSFLQKMPSVGIVGSKLEDRDGTVQTSAFHFHSVLGEFLAGMRLGILDKVFSRWLVAQNHNTVSEFQTDWVAGASMMIKRDVFEQVGLLDEKYFLYYEEEDFCITAKNAGWLSYYVPSSRVVHLVGAASGFSDSRKKQPRRPRYWFESRRRFFLKNYGKLSLSFADIVRMFGFAIWKLRSIIQRKDNNTPPHFFRDLFENSIFIKGFRLY